MSSKTTWLSRHHGLNFNAYATVIFTLGLYCRNAISPTYCKILIFVWCYIKISSQESPMSLTKLFLKKHLCPWSWSYNAEMRLNWNSFILNTLWSYIKLGLLERHYDHDKIFFLNSICDLDLGSEILNCKFVEDIVAQNIYMELYQNPSIKNGARATTKFFLKTATVTLTWT